MSSRAYIIIGIVMLLFASCGQQYHAEKTVKAFVKENMEASDNISGRHFGDLGTTRHLNDSLINVMRQRGAKLFRQGINYGEVPQGDLFYLRMRYIHEGDTLQNTFYLDETLQEVVAFK